MYFVLSSRCEYINRRKSSSSVPETDTWSSLQYLPACFEKTGGGLTEIPRRRRGRQVTTYVLGLPGGIRLNTAQRVPLPAHAIIGVGPVVLWTLCSVQQQMLLPLDNPDCGWLRFNFRVRTFSQLLRFWLRTISKLDNLGYGLGVMITVDRAQASADA